MIDPSKPDLEESVNVTEAHERVLRGAAAAAREHKLSENGAEPVSMWVMALCFIPFAVAGWTLGNAGTLFSYKDTVKAGYVRVIPQSGGEVSMDPVEALAAYVKKGSSIYAAKCNGCHGGGGQGDGANYPSLAGSEWVQGENERFSMIILNGLHGPNSTGKVFGGGGGMPAQGGGLSGTDLACLMTYVRNSFGNKVGDVVTKEMGTAAIEISKARKNAGQQVTGEEINAEHKKTLPGTPLPPSTMVDPLSLDPVEAK